MVFFYFGESSYITRLAQETVPLGLALKGYDHSVLLHHETSAGPFHVSDADAKHADVVDIPTKQNLVAQLNRLGADGYDVDLYIFSHGWDKAFRTSKGTYGENTSVTAAYLEESVKPLNLNAVWQCNCYGASLNPTWLKLGANVAAGSRYVNFYPTRFNKFAKMWQDGTPFAEAVSESDTPASHTPVQAYLLIDAAMRMPEWDGNLIRAAQVLGTGAAAEKYFRACWLNDAWQEGKSGKQNMNSSSTMIVGGNRGVKRA